MTFIHYDNVLLAVVSNTNSVSEWYVSMLLVSVSYQIKNQHKSHTKLPKLNTTHSKTIKFNTDSSGTKNIRGSKESHATIHICFHI